MVDTTDDQIKKALVSVAVENILLKMGKPVLDKVTSNLFGNAHMEIVEKIQNRLQEFSTQKSINKFLEVISH